MCIVEALLAEASKSGHASATELGRAAFTLFHACVMKEGIGGIAANIGNFLTYLTVAQTPGQLLETLTYQPTNQAATTTCE